MRNAVLTVAVGLLLLVSLFWLFRPDSAPAPAPVAGPAATLPAATAPPPSAAPVAAPEPLRVDLQVAGGRLLGEAGSHSLSAGQEVELQLLSDRAGELHLHGYDLVAQVQAGQPARLRFRADHAGRFELELHSQSGHVDLGALEVQPR